MGIYEHFSFTILNGSEKCGILSWKIIFSNLYILIGGSE